MGDYRYALSKRYEDAYSQANDIISMAAVKKIFAVLLGVVGGCVVGVVAYSAQGGLVAASAVVVVVYFASTIWAAAVAASAAAQTQLAVLDVAINTSPLLEKNDVIALLNLSSSSGGSGSAQALAHSADDGLTPKERSARFAAALRSAGLFPEDFARQQNMNATAVSEWATGARELTAERWRAFQSTLAISTGGAVTDEELAKATDEQLARIEAGEDPAQVLRGA